MCCSRLSSQGFCAWWPRARQMRLSFFFSVPFLVEEDALYLAYPKVCLVVDPVSGEQTAELKLPEPALEWGRIRCHGDLLIVPVLEPRDPKVDKQRLPKKLLALDRRSGELRWSRDAENAFCVSQVSQKLITMSCRASFSN